MGVFMRAKRSSVEKLVAEAMCKSAPQRLRDALRLLLDSGMPAEEVRVRYHASYRPGCVMTSLLVMWLVDEWERDKGIIGEEDSIDLVSE
jgi:hypothetical protein